MLMSTCQWVGNARDATGQFEEKELAVKRITRKATPAASNDDGSGQTIVARTAATSGGDGKAMLQRVLELLDTSRTEMKEMRQMITEQFETMKKTAKFDCELQQQGKDTKREGAIETGCRATRSHLGTRRGVPTAIVRGYRALRSVLATKQH